MDLIWGIFTRYLHLIGAMGIPIAFITFDAGARWALGQTDFKALGPDAAQAGCTLFAVTIFGLIYRELLADSSQILTALVWAVICGGVWVVCLMLSFKKFPRARQRQVMASRVLGLLALGLASLFTLHLQYLYI